MSTLRKAADSIVFSCLDPCKTVFPCEYRKKSDPHLPKKVCFICFNESPLRNDKKCFSFNLKNSFRSQDI